MTDIISLIPLDPRLVIAKPRNSVEYEVVMEVESSGNLITTRKRDGHFVYVVITDSVREGIRLYSRGLTDITDKFPYIVEDIWSYQLPKDTLFSAEIVCEDSEGNDNFELLSRLVKSKSDRSIGLAAELGKAKIIPFNLIVRDSEILIRRPYLERLTRMEDSFLATDSRHVSLVEVLSGQFDESCKQAIAQRWEGLVLYDGTAGSDFRLDGKIENTPRPEGCWKWKLVKEDDFVATGWNPSTAASHAGLVKDLNIAQYHPLTGELIDCGKVGIGLSKVQREEYTDDTIYPMVFQIEFERRFEKTKKLRHGRIVRRREDKYPKECLLPM